MQRMSGPSTQGGSTVLEIALSNHKPRRSAACLTADGHVAWEVGYNTPNQHQCVHDTHVVPHVLRVSNGQRRLDTGASHDSRRQLLAASPAPSPIRITPVFQIDNLDIPRRSFLSTVLVPAATRYLQRMYKVKYPVSGSLLLKRSCEQVLTGQWSNGSTVTACSRWAPLTCLESTLDLDHFAAYTTCDARSVCTATPAGAGLASTDFILYVTAKNTSVCQTGTIAYASFCTQDDATDRPTSGSANFCPDQIHPLLNWAFQLDTAVHELTHALGFSAALFKYYRDANNVPLVPRDADGSIPQQADLSAVVRTFEERGTTATKLVTPKVTQAACDQFGCATLNGAELENDGGTGTAGSHWEERIFHGELMTAVSQARPVYSKLTAATLEDSGWYVPTYDVTQPLLWGQGRGCAFPLAACAPGGAVPVDSAFSGFYCGTGFRSWTDDGGVTSALDHTCTDDETAVGYCQACSATDGTCFTDGCMPIVPLSNYVCTDASLGSDSDASNSSSLAYWGQAFGVGSKCVADGSEAWSKNGFERPPVGGGCFRYQCSWDVTGTQATLMIMVGDQAVTCIDGREVPLSAAGFDSGSIGPCPAANAFCESGGCVNDCANQGKLPPQH
ncbi:hypothetical protein KFL_002200055 [Klebsormidium nitens]|uniref:Leishmanolysin-like peptidase n=1 Tax=Klebsormidium nitens TaxID=105231 RepID=A0A1Y1I6S3_KLENI|nr:hypothetical protein KFL_002200055 [Klebsormidium nitens]|eukprot:GAQ85119.1 hypothetical protein KFL_002200055 [Klebsormidium nitens]